MKHKAWFISVICLSMFGIIIYASIIFFIDPYNQYRDSKYYVLNQRAALPGMSKNVDFDTFVLGTSMTENTSTNQINELFDKTSIKLSMSGASLKEQEQIGEIAILAKKKQVRHVIWGIDFFKFNIKDYNYDQTEIPDYLADNSVLNDYKYLVSISTLKDSVKLATKKYNISSRFDTSFPGLDRYGYWADQYEYEEKIVVEDYKRLVDSINESTIFEVAPKETIAQFIKPIIVNNPDTTFNLFITPPSLAYYKYLEQVSPDALEMLSEIRIAMVDELASLPNVHISDFSIETEWTMDLNNYKDITHYKPEINNEMMVRLKNHENALNSNTLKVINNTFEKQVVQYKVPSGT